MKKTVFLLLCCIANTCFGADSLQVQLTSKVLKKGDSLEFVCNLPGYAAMKLNAATLNVWIDDLETGQRWKYRYPMINGEVSASLAVSKKIPDGRYAVNFVLQRGLFRVTGEVIDHDRRDSNINYMMITQTKKNNYIDNTPVAKDGTFRLKNTLFSDSAFFIFTPNNKIKKNYLHIVIETPLDSAFTPVLTQTSFITVGDLRRASLKKKDTTTYSFSVDPAEKGMLPGVTVTTKRKSKMEQYNEEYSHGLFDNPQAIVFDGLGSTQIERSISIFQFLVGRVAGLDVNNTRGGATWRGERVGFYLDEFPIPDEELFFISPRDVAMIKVYRPPSHVGGNFRNTGGEIAIYTKRGKYGTTSSSRHHFIVKGYTNFESGWE